MIYLLSSCNLHVTNTALESLPINSAGDNVIHCQSGEYELPTKNLEPREGEGTSPPKMANENRIAKELLLLISKYPYRRYVQYIAARDAVTDDDFNAGMLQANYWIDKRKCYTSRGINTDHLFELFGLFSDQDGWSVQKEMVEHVYMEQDLYETVRRVVLNMCGCTLEDWITELQDPDNSLDELMLYCLSRTYNCHTLVVCKNRYWSTLEIEDSITEAELFNQCQIQLVYLGNGTFGELKRKPYTQNLDNPVTSEQKQSKLMKIKGRGRPMKRALNLSVKPNPPTCTDLTDPDSTENSTTPTTRTSVTPISTPSLLNKEDRTYLSQVLTEIQSQNRPVHKDSDTQHDTDYLFSLYVQPTD